MLETDTIPRDPFGAHYFQRVVPMSAEARPIQFQWSHSVCPGSKQAGHLELQTWFSFIQGSNIRKCSRISIFLSTFRFSVPPTRTSPVAFRKSLEKCSIR